MRKRKPYRIIGAYDSETTNIDDKGVRCAFPILHQLGFLSVPVTECDELNIEDVCTVELYRHTIELYARLDELVEEQRDYVPVLCCHNLSFDMYGLSQWLDGHDCKVLAKSCRKPITFTILDENGSPALVIWDTLVFSQQPLARMGKDCGYSKATGKWDYERIRTPETPLSDDEREYAKRDIYTLLAWLGWWLRRNPDIEPEKLGLNVVTKTGVVRERRRVRFSNLRNKTSRYSVGQWWYLYNNANLPKSDDELFTMVACTRGGFTFVASRNASIPYDLVGTDRRVIGFDATSQHPAQMISHRYPVGFHKTSTKALEIAFMNVARRNTSYILDNWAKPFTCAYYACFEFDNLRPKAGSLYEEYGIHPLASARFKSVSGFELDEDNQHGQEFAQALQENDYCDKAVNPTFAFGKLVRADRARLYLTELASWELSQAYDFDSFRCLGGYITSRFERPNDFAVISVMQFYKAKNEFKKARSKYFETGTIDNGETLKELGIPNSIVSTMQNGTLDDLNVEAQYLSLKADLNALFGIEASNIFRRDTVLGPSGIEYTGPFGICNAPKTAKACYQFGQRIVGWSRIAQICVMELLHPYIDTVVNGDTDSVKVLADVARMPDIERALSRFADAIDTAKDDNCKRVKALYPRYYDELRYIGHYVHEFDSERFCASWNKAYCMHDFNKRTGKREFAFTLAGIPTRTVQRDDITLLGLNYYADTLYGTGYSFADVCNLLLGYNVTIAPDLTRLNMRKFPEWGDLVDMEVTDYLGNTVRVVEPASLALYPMAKTVNDTTSKENYNNMMIATANNPDVNTGSCIVHAGGIMRFDDGY